MIVDKEEYDLTQDTDFTRETVGGDADRLLRTVTRAFLSDVTLDSTNALGDTCSIVLDIILRNHHQTCVEDIWRVCGRDVPKTRIQKALNVLVAHRILSEEKRLHYSVHVNEYNRLNAPKDRQMQKPKRRGFTRFVYTYQQQQKTQEMVREEKIESMEKSFYYVDYHAAVEVIRFRLWRLLRTDEVLRTVYKCENEKCGKEYSAEEFDMMMSDDLIHHPCAECKCDVKEISPNGTEVAAERRRRDSFRRALDPVIKLLNKVMKNTYIPFDRFSKEETILREEMRKKKEKDSNPGSIEDLVDIEEDLSACPGALDMSARDRSRVIPWLVHHGFFSSLNSDTTSGEDADLLSPDVKRRRISEDQKAVVLQNEEVVEDKDVTKKIRKFDRYILQQLAIGSGDEMDDVPDTVSIRSGSTCSGDEQEAYSEVEVSPGLNASPQQQDQQYHAESVKVCRDFEESLLANQVVYVRGVLRPVETVTMSDMHNMSDDEYTAFANIIAHIAGVS